MSVPVLLGLMTACIIGALAPANSHAAALSLTPRSQLARPGQLVSLGLTAPNAGRCQLRVDARRMRVTLTGSGAFVIRARVSRRARAGTHRLSLRCSTQRRGAVIRVARRSSNRNSRGPLFRGRLNISAAQQTAPPRAPATRPISVNTAPFARPILPATAQAQQWWQSYQSMVVTSFRNGQCTDWAQRRRPDIVQNGYMRRYDLFGSDNVITSWDAKYWVQHAVQAGLAVAHTPVVGAIMVTAPGAYGAGATGHVAVVETVDSNGAFAITQMHAPNVGQVTWQTYSATAAAAIATNPAVTFIL
ncbi:MAG: CHAP domain-containing protein [Solirubrobacteraceae bacterium]